MTVIAILLVLGVAVLPLGIKLYAETRRHHREAAFIARSSEDILRLGPPKTPERTVEQAIERSAASMGRHSRGDRGRLKRVQRLIERYPDRGAAVVRHWLWQG